MDSKIVALSFASTLVVNVACELPNEALEPPPEDAPGVAEGELPEDAEFGTHQQALHVPVSSYLTSGIPRHCENRSLVYKMGCVGQYCRNVVIHCAATGKDEIDSYWTSWFSEEQGSYTLPSGYYAAGLQCSGSYCDNKRMLACRGY